MIQCTGVGRVWSLEPFTTSTNKTILTATIIVNGAGDLREGKPSGGFFKVKFWDAQADFVTKYFVKGDVIGVVGSLKQHNYEDKAGNKRTDIYIDQARSFFVDKPLPDKAVTPVAAGSSNTTTSTTSDPEVDLFEDIFNN